MNVNTIAAKIVTVLTSFVTYAVAASTILTIASASFPTYAGVAAKGIAFLAASVAIVRRVTPIIEAERGLSPVAYPTPTKTPTAVPPAK